MNLNKGLGEVLVPNIQRVPDPKPVLFDKVPVPDLNIIHRVGMKNLVK